jgi:hypothetical protein
VNVWSHAVQYAGRYSGRLVDVEAGTGSVENPDYDMIIVD